MAGFALGIYMGNHSPIHGHIGIAIFSSATAQVLVALFLRPNKDRKNKLFWNIFHYVVGHGIVALSIFNMFSGFSISDSYELWRKIYFGIILALDCPAVILEVIIWALMCKRKMKKKEEEDSHESSRKSEKHKM